jgi:hypothetical protein
LSYFLLCVVFFSQVKARGQISSFTDFILSIEVAPKPGDYVRVYLLRIFVLQAVQFSHTRFTPHAAISPAGLSWSPLGLCRSVYPCVAYAAFFSGGILSHEQRTAGKFARTNFIFCWRNLLLFPEWVAAKAL